jgi:haloacetate dehalogenase
MWGTRGVVGNRPVHPVGVWRERAVDVHGVGVDAGHFLVEEAPGPTLAALREFLSATR